MASTRSTIDLIIRGSLSGLTGAAGAAKAELDALKQRADAIEGTGTRAAKALGLLGKAMLGITAVTGASQVIGGVVIALQNLLPIALLAPAAIAGLGAAFLTLKLGLSGFADAVKSGDLSKLAPQARELAGVIRGLAPEFNKLKLSVQNALFSELGLRVKALAQTFFPVLQRQLPLIAAGFNDMAHGLLDVLSLKVTKFDINDILSNTAKTLGNMPNLLGNVASGFIALAGAGSNYLPRIGTAIENVTRRFRDWADELVTSGRFDVLVEGAQRAFGQIGKIIGNLGQVVAIAFRNLSGGASDPLQALVDLTQALKAFFREAATQDALKSLGQVFRDVADITRTVLLEALKQLAPIIRDIGPFVAECARAFGELLVGALKIVGPILRSVAKFLGEHKELARVLIPLLAGIALKFALLKVGTSIVAGVLALSRALGGLIGILKLGGLVALAAAAVELDKLNVAAAPNGDTEQSGGLADTLHNIVEAGKQVLTLDFAGIFAKIRSELDQTNQAWANGQAPIQQWFDKVKTSFETDFIGFGDRVNRFITDTGTAIGTGVSTWFTGVKDSFQRDFLDVFAGLPGLVGTALSDFGTFVNTAITTVATNLWTGFLNTVTTTFEPVRAFFAQSPYEMGFAIGSGVTGLIIAATNLMTQFGTAVNTGIDTVIASLSTFGDRANTAISNTPGLLLAKGTEIGNAVNTGIGTGLDTVIGVLSGFGDRANAAISNVPGLLGGTATTAGDSVNTGISTGGNNAIGFLSGFGDRANAAISNVPGILLRVATDAGNSFNNAITTAFNTVVSFMSTVGNRINAAIGDLAGMLYRIGADAIAGLGRGISNGFGAIQSAVSNFISGLIAGAKARLGIASPSKVFAKIGANIGEGMALGINSSTGQAIAAARAMTDQLMAQGERAGRLGLVPTAALLGGGSRAGSTPAGITSSSTPLAVTIPIHIGDEVVRVVRTEIDTSNRDVKRTVNAGAGVTAG